MAGYSPSLHTANLFPPPSGNHSQTGSPTDIASDKVTDHGNPSGQYQEAITTKEGIDYPFNKTEHKLVTFEQLFWKPKGTFWVLWSHN